MPSLFLTKNIRAPQIDLLGFMYPFLKGHYLLQCFVFHIGMMIWSLTIGFALVSRSVVWPTSLVGSILGKSIQKYQNTFSIIYPTNHLIHFPSHDPWLIHTHIPKTISCIYFFNWIVESKKVFDRVCVLVSSKDVPSSLVPQTNPHLHATEAFIGSSHCIPKITS